MDIDFIIIFVIFQLAMGFFIRNNRIKNNLTLDMNSISKIKRDIKDIAENLDLKILARSVFFRLTRLKGIVMDYPVSISIERSHRQLSWRVQMEYDSPESYSWNIVPDENISRIQKKLGVVDLELGDSVFDREMVLGSEKTGYIYSLLNHKVRAAILELNRDAGDMFISNNKVIVFLPIKRLDKWNLQYLLGMMAKIPELMSEVSGYKDRLIFNAFNDNSLVFRENNLDILIKEFPLDNKIKDVFRKLLEDTKIQVYAAKLLKEEGLPFLKMLLSSGNAGDDQARQIADYFNESGYSEYSSLLIDYYHDALQDLTKSAIIRAVGSFGDNSSEHFLLRCVNIDNSVELQLDLVKALANCGTPDSLETLSKLVTENIDTYFKHDILMAIEAIHNRFGIKAEHGWMSMGISDDKQGGLSLQSGDSGELSLMEEE